jgi:hypothetical protein
MENRRTREKGLFPQPEFRLVTMDASWSPSDPEIPRRTTAAIRSRALARRLAEKEAIADPMTEFGP